MAPSFAAELARFPQSCLRHDRLSLLEQHGLDESAAMQDEVRHGMAAMSEDDMAAGLARFAAGEGHRVS